MERLWGTEEGQFKKPHLEGGLTMCICVDHQHTSKGPHFSTVRKLKKTGLLYGLSSASP